MMIPTRAARLRTGRAPIFLSIMRRAARSTRVSGLTVMTLAVISSLTRKGWGVPGSPQARVDRRSRSVTMPTSRPLEMTGRWRIRFVRMVSCALFAVSPAPTVMGLAVIQS